ncbi:MAG: hypothetical protein II866_04720 [Prevotella sp.]|nr:hypothetical protein [Prevotella sp.]
MNVKTIKILCGMLLMLAFTACSSDNDERADAPRFYNVTLTASMGDAETRALSVDGNVITATFAAGDKVKVVKSDGTEVGELTANTAGASTTLDGNISGTFSENEVLTFRYRSATANYDGQVGTLAGIADNQDYAEGTLKVIDPNTNPLTFESNSVTLTAKQSITKFTFTDGTNAINVKDFRIIAAGLVQSIATNGAETLGTVTGTLTVASSDAYVALRNNSGDKKTYTFIVKDNAGNWHVGTKNAKLTNGKNYTATVALNSTLTSSSAVGTIGVVGGLPAIVISNTTAVALMNAGAIWPEDYGEYYTFENRASGLTNSWYVPTQAELTSLKNTYSNAWTTQNGVNGRLFTISEGKTFFLPAAGFIDNDNDEGQETAYTGKVLVSTFGYYWSQTEATPSSMAYSLQFSSANINVFSEYEVNALPVRPFHALN